MKIKAHKSRLPKVAQSAAAVLALAMAAAPSAHAISLLTNGDFETGTLAGWTVTDQVGGSGSFFIDDASGSTPLSNHPTVGPAGGAFYAVSDQRGGGTHAISQAFTLAGPVASATLSFDMFVNDWDSGPFINPAGLDYTAGENQHGRVDILSALASPLDTGAGVLSNLYLGVDGGADPNGYTHYMFDLTSVVGGGGTFTLRFAEVDNTGIFNMGVDNVQLEVTAAVPEPGTVVLLGMGLAALGFAGRRRLTS